ncbi:dicarboxylate/amino acid:cation symporter [Clostridium grantii]|uniref:Na+/H+-dicarboxylate symporter n=1 Tax=Clostridium grantii DSM 8605 TaxID=1121316 RepID=A0A1M5WUG4_9CLOT|nr:dicarboxylate/amino acid:cation symporter [Clostridium grantii]SHH90623.1 Na+/H+-dicarboxylate symporter [Clostridium grantii DSM 8605]
MNKQMKKTKLSTKIILAMVLGLIIGLLFNPEISLLPQNLYKLLESYAFAPIGKIFINAIKMLVVPMVFISLVNGVTQISDIKKLGRVGAKTLIFYLSTTALAITIGLSFALMIQPGSNSSLTSGNAAYEVSEAVNFIDILVGMVPTNPLQSMVEGNMLQVIVFSLLLGVSINSIPKQKSKIILDLFDSMNHLVLKMIDIVMLMAPIGVFSLILKVAATLGFDSLIKLSLYMITILLALFVHLTVVYTGSLVIFTKLNPIIFFKKFWNVMTLAFSTSSSNATLPVTMETVEKNFGVHKSIFGFTLPLGATVNMDGTAIMQGVATVFISQIFNVDLTLSQLLTVILTATLASIGTAGVPGVGMITLSMVLTSVGLPVEGIALIIGVDRILDMCRTVVNVTGDAVVTLIVAKSENEIDEEIFYSDKNLMLDSTN